MTTSITWTRTRLLTKPVTSADPNEPPATDRQERIPGFDQARFSTLCCLLVGAGGIGGEIGEGLVRKGIGCLKIFDADLVELSNLNRQRFFKEDLGLPKAAALVRNLGREAVGQTWLVGYPLTLQDALAAGTEASCDVAICGVDNNRTRIFASAHFGSSRIPLVLIGVSNDGSHGYVFVQQPGAACFGCVFPGALEDQRDPCPNTPAIKDILKVVAGIALYAVDSLVMKRPRTWNYKQVFLDGSVPDRSLTVERRPDCTLCARIAAKEPRE